MKSIGCALALGVLGLISLRAQQAPPAQNPVPPPGPDWSFPIISGPGLPAEPDTPVRLAGSTKQYTPAQIDDLLNPPDWYPDAHPPAPSIVTTGHGGAFACGACHLMNGSGHPESSSLTGLTAAYIVQQMADFKSGTRKEFARMNGIAKEVSDEEVRQAAEYFVRLPARSSTTIREAAMVPKTLVGAGRMRFVDPKGGMEPIGVRLITVPADQERARHRDPTSGFIVYAPPGSIARGRALAETGGSGRTIACTTCHGEGLKGLGNVPRLAGLHPIYVVRQLTLFRDGRRAGTDAALMRVPVARLTDQDIVNLSAYLGSLNP